MKSSTDDLLGTRRVTGEQSSARTGEEGCPGGRAEGPGLGWCSCPVGTGGVLDREKGMARRRETWRRTGRANTCETAGEGGSASRAENPHYWRKHGGFVGPEILLEVLPQVTEGWS